MIGFITLKERFDWPMALKELFHWSRDAYSATLVGGFEVHSLPLTNLSYRLFVVDFFVLWPGSLLSLARALMRPPPRDTPIHVLLNKTDLFEEMIREVPLSSCFPEYSGPPDQVLPAISFVEGAYDSATGSRRG